jgi:hypothetical protein
VNYRSVLDIVRDHWVNRRRPCPPSSVSHFRGKLTLPSFGGSGCLSRLVGVDVVPPSASLWVTGSAV